MRYISIHKSPMIALVISQRGILFIMVSLPRILLLRDQGAKPITSGDQCGRTSRLPMQLPKL